MRKNNPQLWDEIWKDNYLHTNVLELEREQNGVRWKRLEKVVIEEFRSFRNLEILELGGGIGINSALMAMRGANVTVIDYSQEAIKRSKDFFVMNGLKVKYFKENVLSLPSELLNRYDISMSFGLAEHFHGIERIDIIKAHFNVLKKGGISFISVPNKINLPYRIFKYVSGLTGQWRFGEEYPYSRKELKEICHNIGILQYSFFGDSLIRSFNFIVPNILLKKIFKFNKEVSFLRKEIETPLDEYLSYALVLCGKK